MTEREMKQRKAAARKARQRKARNRRVLTTVALMLVVCVASIGGTIAWLTDTTEEVTNTFTPSTIGLTLTETVPENQTAKMIPGSDISKDPKVTVTAGSEKSWVFLKVTEVGPAVGGKTFDDFLTYTVITGEDDWIAYDAAAYPGLYYRTVEKTIGNGTDTEGNSIDTSVDFPILVDNKVSVKDTVTKAMMAGLGNNSDNYPKLTFQAAAVQYDNIDSVSDAFDQVKSDLGYEDSNTGN